MSHPARPVAAQTTAERAAQVMRRCDELGALSEESGRLTRRYGTPALRRAQELVAGWMRQAGLDVRRDAVGNLIGRSAGAAPEAPALLLGSHLDSVRDAGRYDGPLGVIAAIACAERLAHGPRLPFALELVAFADEEGLRFRTSFLGSAVLTGSFGPAELDRTDADGRTLRDAIRDFGGDPERLRQAAYAPEQLLGYCEVHIEQGPVLEHEGLPVGVVSAIQGQSRAELSWDGKAGHAGTVPMALRRDALCAAAELVLAVEVAARARDGLVATVGELAVEPGAGNVVPGAARLTLDLRHPEDGVRRAAFARLEDAARAIAARRGVALSWNTLPSSDSVVCDPELTDLLAGAIRGAGVPVRRLPSGAGHDAMIVARLAPVAMLFVRCAAGVSHNPAEAVAAEDVAVAIDVLDRFVLALADSRSHRSHDAV